jgi:hypothetical protein
MANDTVGVRIVALHWGVAPGKSTATIPPARTWGQRWLV